jgi:hypothetical protein
MTELLKKAFDKVAEEMSDYEQDEFGRWLLDAIEKDEERWDATFAQSTNKLERLASAALEVFRTGRSETLDPEKL